MGKRTRLGFSRKQDEGKTGGVQEPKKSLWLEAQKTHAMCSKGDAMEGEGQHRKESKGGVKQGKMEGFKPIKLISTSLRKHQRKEGEEGGEKIGLRI